MDKIHNINEDFKGHEKRHWILKKLKNAENNLMIGVIVAVVGVFLITITPLGIVGIIVGGLLAYKSNQEVNKWKRLYNRHMGFAHFSGVSRKKGSRITKKKPAKRSKHYKKKSRRRPRKSSRRRSSKRRR